MWTNLVQIKRCLSIFAFLETRMQELEDQTPDILEEHLASDYKYGFVSDIESDKLPPGLDEDTIREISRRKEEPEWMLEFRLNAFEKWKKMVEPHWANAQYDPIDYQAISYYSAPRMKPRLDSIDEVDEELLETFERLGIPLAEQKRLMNVAVDAVFDSVSVKTTHQDELEKYGVIFCSFSEAVKNHPEIVRKWLGTVVPPTDNFFAALNSAVFSDGSFAYIPKGVKCPMDLSTYFRINTAGTGQFERTLIIAEEGSAVNYLEGCTAPQRDENQLHAAVVEIIALDDALVNYSTVQNWYAGDENGVGGIYNLVTKRGRCLGDRSSIRWVQVEAGAAITWKYPSVLLDGDDSVGEFYSVALTKDAMQADTGTKMIHRGKRTRSTIISKGISAGTSENCYRGLVQIMPSADGARNYSQCDSMLVGDKCGAHTFPYIECRNASAVLEHEASTSKISADQIFYLQSRGLDEEQVISMIVNGFAGEVFRHLPMEFAVEAVNLLEMKLEHSVG